MSVGGDKNDAALAWLREIFGNEPVPKSTRSAAIDDYICTKMRDDKALENSIDCYKKFKSDWAAALSADAEQKQLVLEAMNISTKEAKTSHNVETLADVASSLSIADVEESNYILALTDLMLEKEKTTSEIEALTMSMDDGKRDLIKGLEMIKDLEQLSEQLHSAEAETQKTMKVQAQEAEFLSKKVDKYKSDKKKLDIQMSSVGISANITHPKLVADADDLQALKTRLEQAEQNLAMYASLPPDKALAQVKLAVAKSELQDLEDELSKEIDRYHI